MKLVPVVAAVATASIASMVNAQCGTGGSCFEIHGPYCNDADCCNAVCGVDPYCCNNSWDGFCVQEANELCLGCGNPGTGSCYATGGPYCNDAECCDYVCSIDSYCCNILLQPGLRDCSRPAARPDAEGRHDAESLRHLRRSLLPATAS